MQIRTAFTATLISISAAASLAACGSDDTKDSAAKGDTAGTCSYVATGDAAKKVDLPKGEPTEKGDVPVVIKTSRGDIGITLDGKSAPCTVNSFLSLAKQDFYDKTPCPRISSGSLSMLQCGDPKGDGRGTPGYTIPDEITGTETYPAGTVAMANTGTPNTGGSQFFLVFEDSQLDPAYTVFGHIDAKGLKVLRGVAAKGDDGSNPYGGGVPNESIDIKDVVVG